MMTLKQRKTRQFCDKGLIMSEIRTDSKYRTVQPTYALPNKGKVKAVKLEGVFTAVSIGPYTEGTFILSLTDSVGQGFTMIGPADLITGFELY